MGLSFVKIIFIFGIRWLLLVLRQSLEGLARVVFSAIFLASSKFQKSEMFSSTKVLLRKSLKAIPVDHDWMGELSCGLQCFKALLVVGFLLEGQTHPGHLCGGAFVSA